MYIYKSKIYEGSLHCLQFAGAIISERRYSAAKNNCFGPEKRRSAIQLAEQQKAYDL
jgi:hypothetical protein